MKSIKILPLVLLQIVIVAGSLSVAYLSASMQRKADTTKQDLKPVITVMKQIALQREEMDYFNNPLPKGTEAPSFALTDETGNLVLLKNFKGKKVMLLFTSASNCPNCIALIPILQQLQKQMPKLQILCLMHDSSPKDNKMYKQINNIPYKLLASTMEQLESYHIDLLPTSVIIDEDGKVEQTFRASTIETFVGFIQGKMLPNKK